MSLSSSHYYLRHMAIEVSTDIKKQAISNRVILRENLQNKTRLDNS